jgi:hypothetical protein
LEKYYPGLAQETQQAFMQFKQNKLKDALEKLQALPTLIAQNNRSAIYT